MRNIQTINKTVIVRKFYTGAGRFVEARFAKPGDISDKNFKVDGLERHDIAVFINLSRFLCVLTIRKTKYIRNAQNGSKRLLNAF